MSGDATSTEYPGAPSCRHCRQPMTIVMADLGSMPIANDYLPLDADFSQEARFPLVVHVCSHCRLAQTEDHVAADRLFRSDYAYFSSTSPSWVEHARNYVEAMKGRFGIGPGSRHVEIASNDGYLLQFSQAASIPCIGVEPCESVAAAALEKGIDTRVRFFGRKAAADLKAEGWSADLITANNVLAHVPDLNDFVGGVADLLAPEGVATFEVQHLLSMMKEYEFDTIYHEHFSYYSLLAAKNVFRTHGLRVFDVDLLPTHGGSIRFYVCHASAAHAETANVEQVLASERAFGLDTDAVYEDWREALEARRSSLNELVRTLRAQGKSIVAYGAPAKGNTLLNFCGIGEEMIEFTVDRAPSKQNRLLPGTHLRIFPPDAIVTRKPDYVLILPWNLKDEIKQQLSNIREWGGHFIVPVPDPHIED